MDLESLKQMGLYGMGLYGQIHCHTKESPLIQGVTAFKGGKPIETADLGEMFRQFKSAEEEGELFKLMVSIVPHRQGPNGNFWRILPKAYSKIAKSFTGMVFQRDHSLKQESRGGTILSSTAKGSGESAFMIQDVEIVEPWAIEGFLRGTIDRFSIQLNMHDIKAYCSICGAAIGEWCSHYPGQSYEVEGKSQICWWEVHAGTGKETSAVTDPAVSGTHIQDIMQLAASLRGPQPSSEEDPMKIEELQAELASQKEAVTAKEAEVQEVTEKLKALMDEKEKLAADMQAAQTEREAQAARADGLHQRICADVAGQINTTRAAKENEILFEGEEPVSIEIAAGQDLGAAEDKLRRTLLADQILIERDARHDGKDFIVADERKKLLEKSVEALPLALEQWSMMPPLVQPPQMGEGAALIPGDGARAEQDDRLPIEEDGALETFTADDLLALTTGRADVTR